MRILKDLIEHAEETLEEIEDYTIEAHHLRVEHKALADSYIKIAETHVEIYKILHERMVALIMEEKQKGAHVPPEMQAIWDYEHEKMVRRFGDVKVKIEEYKKTY